MELSGHLGARPKVKCQAEDVLTLNLDDGCSDFDFESVHDVPFITVNRVDGQYRAEVILSGNPATDTARIQEALDVGYTYGVHAFARKWGAGGNHLAIFFTPDHTGDE